MKTGIAHTIKRTAVTPGSLRAMARSVAVHGGIALALDAGVEVLTARNEWLAQHSSEVRGSLIALELMVPHAMKGRWMLAGILARGAVYKASRAVVHQAGASSIKLRLKGGTKLLRVVQGATGLTIVGLSALAQKLYDESGLVIFPENDKYPEEIRETALRVGEFLENAAEEEVRDSQILKLLEEVGTPNLTKSLGYYVDYIARISDVSIDRSARYIWAYILGSIVQNPGKEQVLYVSETDAILWDTMFSKSKESNLLTTSKSIGVSGNGDPLKNSGLAADLRVVVNTLSAQDVVTFYTKEASDIDVGFLEDKHEGLAIFRHSQGFSLGYVDDDCRNYTYEDVAYDLTSESIFSILKGEHLSEGN